MTVRIHAILGNSDHNHALKTNTGAKTLCEKMRGFISKEVFPQLKSHVSTYTFRHNFASEAKAALGADGAAVCLGHHNDLSQTFYSRAKKQGYFRIDSVNGQRNNIKHVAKKTLICF